MTIDFNVKDVIHMITVKFVHAFLPNAKKSYNLKAMHQPELGIHEIASKAAVYNIATSPKVIEEGLKAGIELIFYLVADGFKIKTPLFNLKMCIPGEYNGSETSLTNGSFPMARLQPSMTLRKYLKEKVVVTFGGFDKHEGLIAEAYDEATGILDEVMTVGNLLTIRGTGMKIVSDDEHKNQVGVSFRDHSGKSVKAEIIAVNEPKTLKVIVPPKLCCGTSYQIEVVTQGSAKGSGQLLKKLRTMCSGFRLEVA